MENNSKYPCKNCMYHRFFKKNPDGTIEYYCPYDECVKDAKHTYKSEKE